MERLFRLGKKLIPARVFRALQPTYHWLLALGGALLYRFPSRRLFVIAVTGTKGKSSVAELIAHILKADGKRVALANTIHFDIDGHVERNLFKMTMPGRAFAQRFLRRALSAGCTHVVLEVTSEGIRQHRHRFIDFDAVVFTNLAPEHIESHGSFEAYANAKLSLVRALEHSRKRPRCVVANTDDAYGQQFLDASVEVRRGFSLKHAEPYTTGTDGATLTFNNTILSSPLVGEFAIYNILAAATLADAMGVPPEAIANGVANTDVIAGRGQEIDAGQDFTVVVDYAHTPESLEAIYRAYGSSRKICVLGATGGGRDKTKRAAMGKTAAVHCDEIILTDEDPYDEPPEAIIRDVASGVSKIQMPNAKCQIILDRREAICKALARAKPGDAVLITGKGTDPYIMGARGTKTPWSDADVAREELARLSSGKAGATTRSDVS